MQERTRKTLFFSCVVLLLALLGFWWYSGFSLGFMRFFAAEPAPSDQKTPAPASSCQPRPACLDATPACDIPEPAPGWCQPVARAIVSCAPARQTVSVGGTAPLTASGGSGQYEWFAPGSTPAISGVTPPGVSFGARYLSPGTKKVTVQSGRGDGTNVDSVACTVIVQ